VSFSIASVYGWRVALAAMGVMGVVALGVLATQRRLLTSHRAPDTHATSHRGAMQLFLQPAIALCFCYFVAQTMAAVGLQTFLPSALNAGFDVPLALATSAVTAYLLGSTAGIAAGGYFATRTQRHDRIAAAGLLTGAALLALVATGWVPLLLLIPLFVAAGFALGATGPSRDLIVRNATPKGAAGRVYGFVYSGLDLGAMIGPVWFGLMLDNGHPRQMFLVVSILLVIAVGTVLQARRSNVLAQST
jgi:predicted MFS family arabinose efflux permease